MVIQIGLPNIAQTQSVHLDTSVQLHSAPLYWLEVCKKMYSLVLKGT